MVAELWPGVPAAWSRHVQVPSSAAVDSPGTVHTWHILDNAPDLAARGVEPAGTLLCVHGNPTWSYLWRTLAAAGSTAERPWRVIAVDQLDMGYSDRTGTFRRLADRITDLGDLTQALGVAGPVVSVGHDWGGIISLGWALAHRKQLAGVVLTNTAVHPAGFSLPPALRLALHPAVHGWARKPPTRSCASPMPSPARHCARRSAGRMPNRTGQRRGARASATSSQTFPPMRHTPATGR